MSKFKRFGKIIFRGRIPFGNAFTLVELIVVITILAILATIGFLALSGYTQDARDSAIKANVRSVQSAISAESTVSGNSPRFYVVHDTGAALSGAFVYVDGVQTALTGGAWNQTGTNYSAGNPDYAKLKLNPEKFKVAGLGRAIAEAFAAYDAKYLSVGAMEAVGAAANGGKPRAVSYFQVAGVAPATGAAVVSGNYPASSGSVAGLVKDPGSASSTGALVDGATAGTSNSVPSETGLYAFTTHTFSNCGQTGYNWPSLASCRTSYGTSEANGWKNTYLNMTTNGIQEWTVPKSWTYRIRAVGARGAVWWSAAAGYWASMRGDFYLTKWTKINIVVGQKWIDNETLNSVNWWGGGGGGSFVYVGSTLMLAAGGGGAGSLNNDGSPRINGQNASTAEAGVASVSCAAGGTGGGNGTGEYPGKGWNAVVSNPTGFAPTNSSYSTGGFGWGGSAFYHGWAGGGGYSGGGGRAGGSCGTSYGDGGGGGGSFNSWTNQLNAAWQGTSDGTVTVDFVS